jgi:hypothetical protein
MGDKIHIHRSSHDRVWLPTLNGLLEPHPFCRSCGAVKNISSDKAHGLGYFINVLAEIKRHLDYKGGKLSQAQIRLIIKELESREDFADTYVMLGSVQRNIFINVVQKYTGLSRSFVESFL